MKRDSMHGKIPGVLSLICLVITILWLVFLIVGTMTAGPLDTFEQTLAHVSRLDAMYYLTYVNAALITVGVVMLFASLYVQFQSESPQWSAIGAVFVPIYGALNLMVYLSQITVVPHLLEFQSMPEYHLVSQLLLRQFIQQWPESAISIVNNLAYAILGIPSILFGILMFKSVPALRLAGILFALNGIACIMGFMGVVAQSQWLGQGALIGGVFFLLALVPMSRFFLQCNNKLPTMGLITS